ncbi:hypothetical protein [Rudanella lutea]|uniref:hypothetical protein n=1 Tax=Rudanella lutea TaxID=451374 RepID=UPI000369CC5C|nr:hypothetical protein [Rudanella lutea]
MTRHTDSIFISYHHNDSLRDALIELLQNSFNHSSFWLNKFEQLTNDSTVRFHLGIFVEPFLQYILEGKKTVESRFSVNQSAPFGKVQSGDILLLKRSGGPVIGLCHITHVWSYQLTPVVFEQVQQTFASALCLEGSDFWHHKKEAQYATLMAIDEITCFDSVIYIDKRDRRGWVVLD